MFHAASHNRRGPGVRLAAALVTPVIPLLMLLCCVGLECFKRGSGLPKGWAAALRHSEGFWMCLKKWGLGALKSMTVSELEKLMD